MTTNRKWFLGVLTLATLLIALVVDHYAAEARHKKTAEHTGQIYEKQMERLRKGE